MNDNDYRSFIGDLHYPARQDRYYMTYGEAVKMLVENVYRDDELYSIKATQMMSVTDVLSFMLAFVVRCFMAVLSPVIAPLFAMSDKRKKIKYLKNVFFLTSYHSGVLFGYVRVRQSLARWVLK